MTNNGIPYQARVLVADGRKALLLRNVGNELHPSLMLEASFDAPPNPRTHEQGTDTPGRAITLGRRSAMEQTDWHLRAEEAFVGEVHD